MATTIPPLTTERLLLRPFGPADAPDVQRLAGAREIADTTLHVAHPYEPGMAEAWIATHADGAARGERFIFAITRREDGALAGAIGLSVIPAHRRAELGYWIGVPFWRNGYATEAAIAVLDFAFGPLALHRVHAAHFARNPASGRVLVKAGLRLEGVSRGHFLKWDRFEDAARYAILEDEWRIVSRRRHGS